MRYLILESFEAQHNFRDELFDSAAAQTQFRNCVTAFLHQAKAQYFRRKE